MRRPTLLLGISFALSKVIGLLRETLFASYFGAGSNNPLYNLDVYVAAFRIPDFLYNLLSYGVLSAAFIPLFLEKKKKESSQGAFRFTNQVIVTLTLAVGVASLGALILAPWIVKALVPGFSEENLTLTTQLTRLMLVTPLLFTWGTLAGGLANAYQKLWGIALAPIAYNLGIVAGVVFFGREYGVYGVALGVVAGAVLNVAVQLPGMFRTGFRFIKVSQIWNTDVRALVLLALPRILGMSISQVAILIATIIASTLPVGSLVIMSYATNIQFVPIGLIGISSAVAAFASLAGSVADNAWEKFTETIRRTLDRMLLFLVPMSFGLYILRNEVTRLILLHGNFSLSDAVITAHTVGILATGIVFSSCVFLLSRAFYANKNTLTPVVVGVISVVVDATISIVTTKIFHMNTYGLAWGQVSAAITNAVLLYILLRQKHKTELCNLRSLGKIFFASGVMSGILILGAAWFGPLSGEASLLILAVRTGVLTLVGIMTYGITLILLEAGNRKKDENLLTLFRL